VSRDVRKQRLIKRGNQELVTQDMENFAQMLNNKTQSLGGVILDSKDENLEKNIEIVLDLVKLI
jgi:dephospho-CoA kinase